MKTETLFASIFLSLFTCLPVALAAPTPVGYKVLPEPPPPGHSGVYHDTEKNEIQAHYGEKDMKGHMEHGMYNVRKYPQNDRAFKPVSPGNKDNRKRAMATTKPLKDFARDEKPPNSAVHDGKTQTLRYLPLDESNRERNLLSTTTRRARTTGAKMRYYANPGPNYHGRGDRSLSRQTAPGVKTGTSSRPPWNAGPGRQRSDSAGPYPKGRAPEPKTTPKQLKDGTPTRERSPGPVAGPSKPAGGGKGKERAREPSSSSSSSRSGSSSRSPSRDHSPGVPEPSKSRSPTPEPDTKGKGKAPSPSKPAWNAGPGAQAAIRKSSRIATLPPKMYKT